MRLKFVPQHDFMDCGPACLAMVAGAFGKQIPLQYLREHSFLTKEGVSLLSINDAAERIGMEGTNLLLPLEELRTSTSHLPCILHWNQNHFVVLYKIQRNFFTGQRVYKIADPGYGLISLSEDKMAKYWVVRENSGVALFLKPTDQFYKLIIPQEPKISIKFLLKYLKPFKKQLAWLSLLLLFGTITTLVLPLLTQYLIDDGVAKKNVGIITYILLAQLAFFLGNIVIEIFRNWITLKLGARINIQIISEFLKKLLKLPIKFFDTKMMGDFNQRIQDHERIEQFLTSQSLVTFFSITTFSVFFAVLWYYNLLIVSVYITLTAISIMWSLFWLEKRKVLDYVRFQQRSENQESIYEIVNGVTEIKLNQFEDLKREEWEQIQLKLFKTNTRILKVNQIQYFGFEFVNQIKNILVTFLAAYFVVIDTMTLGALLSVSYIIGQMNGPVNQLIAFFRSLQDAKLSLARLNEVQKHPAEEQRSYRPICFNSDVPYFAKINEGIRCEKVSFQYEGPRSPFVLQDNNIHIEEGKVTAIVGASGSGKTTLMKLLLKFYDPTEGVISYNTENILDVSPSSIRKNSGVVMQDGYIFSDTIERNIATGDREIDQHRLEHAVEVANIKSFIDSLPLGFKTKIGSAGNGISGGQKQRILIARAVYKDPHYLFFDEATSALDAENEKIIHNNLQSFFKGKTVVIIAHRLSTVKNADKIIVLKNGKIVEEGNHTDLVMLRSNYYNLVKNQLELGN